MEKSKYSETHVKSRIKHFKNKHPMGTRREFIEKIDKIYIKTFIQYLNVSDVYADIKNKNNFFILLSIASQILGITFLLLLFRSLVSEKVYD